MDIMVLSDFLIALSLSLQELFILYAVLMKVRLLLPDFDSRFRKTLKIYYLLTTPSTTPKMTVWITFIFLSRQFCYSDKHIASTWSQCLEWIKVFVL